MQRVKHTLSRPVVILSILLVLLVLTSFSGCKFGRKEQVTTSEATKIEPVSTQEAPNVPGVVTKKTRLITISPRSESVVYLSAPIFEDSVNLTIAALARALAIDDKAYLLINSPGGSVLAGAKLVEFIKYSSKPVYTVCMGICASMAFHTFQSGKVRFATPSSVLMAHPYSGGTEGTGPNMTSLNNFVNRYTDKMDAYAANRIGVDFNQFKVDVMKNVWIDGEDSVEKKYADKLVFMDLDYNTPIVYISTQNLPFIPKQYLDLYEKFKGVR